MKRFLLSVVLATTLALASCSDPFDDTSIWEKLDEYGESIRDHEQRLSVLEELCKQMNTNISSLQTIVEALQNNDYVTAVVPVVEDGITIGYTITFTKSQPITIYHGEDGKDGENRQNGKDGYTPQIGVKQDSDNIYYWTLDGEWLLDAKGNKIQANGIDGTNGTNGQDGKDGVDGVTPQLKIENDYWHISYDNGATWTQLGKATGEDGQNGDSFFKSVEQDEECVYFTLADGTAITLPKYKEAAETSNKKIYYTTSDGKKLFPNNTAPGRFGAILISNTYENGQGILTFDDAITSIGDSAFSGCTSLTSITIPDSVTTIGKEAFWHCTSLTNVTFDNCVTSVATSAFAGCTSLKRIDITNLSAFCKIKIQDTYAAPCCYGAQLYLNGEEITELTIPADITRLNFANFQGCSSLTTVTLHENVISINSFAFSSCKNLTTVYCKATTSPEARIGSSSGTWGAFNKNATGRIIYVPKESVDKYKAADGWSNYADSIVGYDF